MKEGYILKVVSNNNETIQSMNVHVEAKKPKTNTFKEECKKQNIDPDIVDGFREVKFDGDKWVETGKFIKPEKEGNETNKNNLI